MLTDYIMSQLIILFYICRKIRCSFDLYFSFSTPRNFLATRSSNFFLALCGGIKIQWRYVMRCLGLIILRGTAGVMDILEQLFLFISFLASSFILYALLFLYHKHIYILTNHLSFSLCYVLFLCFGCLFHRTCHARPPCLVHHMALCRVHVHWRVDFVQFPLGLSFPLSCVVVTLNPNLSALHTHTHTHTYIPLRSIPPNKKMFLLACPFSLSLCFFSLLLLLFFIIFFIFFCKFVVFILNHHTHTLSLIFCKKIRKKINQEWHTSRCVLTVWFHILLRSDSCIINALLLSLLMPSFQPSKSSTSYSHSKFTCKSHHNKLKNLPLSFFFFFFNAWMSHHLPHNYLYIATLAHTTFSNSCIKINICCLFLDMGSYFFFQFWVSPTGGLSSASAPLYIPQLTIYHLNHNSLSSNDSLQAHMNHMIFSAVCGKILACYVFYNPSHHSIITLHEILSPLCLRGVERNLYTRVNNGLICGFRSQLWIEAPDANRRTPNQQVVWLYGFVCADPCTTSCWKTEDTDIQTFGYDLGCPLSELKIPHSGKRGMTPHPEIYILRQEHPLTRTPETSSSPRTLIGDCLIFNTISISLLTIYLTSICYSICLSIIISLNLGLNDPSSAISPPFFFLSSIIHLKLSIDLSLCIYPFKIVINLKIFCKKKIHPKAASHLGLIMAMVVMSCIDFIIKGKSLLQEEILNHLCTIKRLCLPWLLVLFVLSSSNPSFFNSNSFIARHTSCLKIARKFNSGEECIGICSHLFFYTDFDGRMYFWRVLCKKKKINNNNNRQCLQKETINSNKRAKRNSAVKTDEFYFKQAYRELNSLNTKWLRCGKIDFDWRKGVICLITGITTRRKSKTSTFQQILNMTTVNQGLNCGLNSIGPISDTWNLRWIVVMVKVENIDC
ncbi:hypothetical protein VP01_204g3 [Puccinia sorghi]|uniref:Uncharacterized protein n=1 Tax=Puccinia sorghi TaxID=27349 RepID=A0A0L6VAX4_9BASI|nr:hypothetical protein VP01_204g3 [Puccinia sorghi]